MSIAAHYKGGCLSHFVFEDPRHREASLTLDNRTLCEVVKCQSLASSLTLLTTAGREWSVEYKDSTSAEVPHSISPQLTQQFDFNHLIHLSLSKTSTPFTVPLQSSLSFSPRLTTTRSTPGLTQCSDGFLFYSRSPWTRQIR